MFLDQDFYKFTMLQLIWRMPEMQAKFKLFDRKNKVLPIWDQIRPILEEKIEHQRRVLMTHDEAMYLNQWFDTDFIEYLLLYHDYGRASIDLTEGITIEGTWLDTSLWEIPLLQMVNEAYIEITNQSIDLVEYIGRTDQIHKFNYVEFGTRRRSCQIAQEVAIQRMKYNGGKYTSNVHFARKYGLEPKGTYAHELVMGLSSIYREDIAQYEAIRLLRAEFPKMKIYALTDTYTTERFLSNIDKVLPIINGFRHDSGDPLDFINKVKQYNLPILFSDGLDLLKMLRIKVKCIQHELEALYGVGTWLTNCEDRPDTVIKLVEVNGHKVIKLSDNPAKSIGI